MPKLADLLVGQGNPSKIALIDHRIQLSYEELTSNVSRLGQYLAYFGCVPGCRVAVITTNSVESVVAILSVSQSGSIFVPINAKLPLERQADIVRDSGAMMIVAPARHKQSEQLLTLVGALSTNTDPGGVGTSLRIAIVDQTSSGQTDIFVQQDSAAIFYTSGSTGKPNGVLVSNSNLSIGATSVNQYLKNTDQDVILGVLPISFDAGFSQVSTGLLAGGTVVLQNFLFANDSVRIALRYGVTAITAVPTLWRLLMQSTWPEAASEKMRCCASTGGRMPAKTLRSIRQTFPNASPYIMYGLTEAFRGTYLPPSMIDRKIGSIGIAIPSSEILVMRDHAVECDTNEVGELVQVGPLVAQGYWAKKKGTYAHFDHSPDIAKTGDNCVWSGDLVKRDEDGYLYFEGRRDGMMKVNGHRICPEEVEAVVLEIDSIIDCCAFENNWTDDMTYVHVLVVIDKNVIDMNATNDRSFLEQSYLEVIGHLQTQLARYALPKYLDIVDSIPRDLNGKIDRVGTAELARQMQV